MQLATVCGGTAPAAAVARNRPPPLAIGQSELYEWARGLVWDCTRETSECCVVADFHAPATAVCCGPLLCSGKALDWLAARDGRAREAPRPR